MKIIWSNLFGILVLSGIIFCYDNGNSEIQLRSLDPFIFKKYGAQISEMRNLINVRSRKSFYSFESNIKCGLCNLLYGVIQGYRLIFRDDNTLKVIATELCSILKIQKRHICASIIELNLPIILKVFNETPGLTGTDFCGVVFQSEYCKSNTGFMDYTININRTKTRNMYAKESLRTAKRTSNDLVILQLTDFHYDPNYEEGAFAQCGEPVCCRADQGYPKDKSLRAGRWGDYRDCDIPWITIQNTFDHITDSKQNFDIIYFTGDIIDHGIWATSYGYNKKSMKKVFQALRDTFKGKQIFPIVGNHEQHPVNQFAPSKVDAEGHPTLKLYEFLADEWSSWLPNDALETVKLGGYYTVLIRPGLRLIALNSNVCMTYNWYIMLDPTNPSIQLQWFHDVLLEAENNNEIVHIISHVPTGEEDCFNIWGREYRRIIDRFYKIINAQFNGHTHRDEFNIFYSRKEGLPINVAWNGGSITPLNLVNPNYRVYYTNPETFEVTDHETWTYNLTLANIEDNVPEWFKLYSFQKEYKLKDLSPKSLNGLVERMARNISLLQRYWQLKGKLGDAYLAQKCDDKCLQSHLCDIVTTEFGDDSKCKNLYLFRNY